MDGIYRKTLETRLSEMLDEHGHNTQLTFEPRSGGYEVRCGHNMAEGVFLRYGGRKIKLGQPQFSFLEQKIFLEEVLVLCHSI